MDLKHVYDTIESNDIQVFPCDIKDVKSVSIEVDKRYGIFINYNEIENSDEEFLVATHEYGHCKSGSTHPLYSPFDIVARHEYRADRKAVIDFLPIEQVKNAIEHGCRTPFEFSEFLEVPEAFVIKVFKHYNAMNLI